MAWLETIAKKVQTIDGISTKVTDPKGLSNRAPTLHIMWDPAQLHITGYEVAEDLGRKPPRVAIGDHSGDGKTSVNITPNQMQPGEAEVVAERLFGLVSQKRNVKPKDLKPPSFDLSGQWLLDVEFFSSRSQHQLFIDQKGNWIEGMHKTDFQMLEMVGMIEQDNIKLRSNFRVPGNGITYLFSGKATRESINGSIYMGEYLTAKFTATRNQKKHAQKPILIPGGPPLAT
jgi:hypothetical protein